MNSGTSMIRDSSSSAPEISTSTSNAKISFPTELTILKYLLECPVCTDHMTGIVRMCIMGHSMCECCFTKISKLPTRSHCPLCRKALSPFSARNYALENLAAVCRFTCRFMDRGCCKILEGHQFNIHLKECPFRDFRCDMYYKVELQPICSSPRLGITDFINHLTHDHNVPRVQNGAGFKRRLVVADGIISPPLVLLDFDEKVFFCNFTTIPMKSKDSCILMCWIGMTDEDEDCRERNIYNYKLTCDKDGSVENCLVLGETDAMIEGMTCMGRPVPLSRCPQESGWVNMIDISPISFLMTSNSDKSKIEQVTEVFWKETVNMWKSGF